MALATEQRPGAKPITKEWRKWEGVNLRDSRTAIGDTEFAWLENAITIGAGSIQILPKQGASVATLSQGIAKMKGFTLNGLPILMAVGLDGSLTQVSPFGTVTAVAPAGTVSINADMTIYQGSRVLIIDPSFGYLSWNGTTFQVLDATEKGEHISVFQGRVWISKGRTIIYTSPNTFNDFNPANGSGSTNITDEAFEGNIFALVSALEQLWIVGASAVEALSNVQAFGVPPNVLTSFSISNVVSSVGSTFSASVIGYFRALVFSAPFGVYALSGVTPQKISEKLDDFPFQPAVAPVADVPAAVAVVQNTLAVLFLVNYTGSQAFAGAGPIQLVAGFVQGKWFLAYQGNLLWITTLTVSGVSQAWGTDGTTIYQLFGSSTCTPVGYKVQSKLYDFGSAVTEKQLYKLGVELRAQPAVAAQQIFCILNNPVLAGENWTLESGARPNAAFPAASFFVDDTTVYGFHLFDGAAIQPMRYDISTDGGVTFPTTNVATTYNPTGNADVIGIRTITLPSNTRRVITLHNNSFALAFSDDLFTKPLGTSTWTEKVALGGVVGAPSCFEVSGQNLVLETQDGGGNILMAFSTDAGTTLTASASNPADTVVGGSGKQQLASPAAGIWVLVNAANGKIYRSTDSGNNWGAAVFTITAGDAALPAISAVMTIDSGRMVAVWKGQIATSDDKGVTWTLRQNLTLPVSSPTSVQQARIAYFGNFGVPAGSPQLGGMSTFLSTFANNVTASCAWRSTDRGLTWSIQPVVGGANHGSASVAMTAFAARNGRGVVDLWNFGATARDTWHATGIPDTAVCMTLVNNAGQPLTLIQGTAPCPPQAYSPDLFADSELASVAVPVYGPGGIIFIINNVGARMTLVNNSNNPLTIISGGLSLSKSDATLFGHYLGWTLQGTDPPFRIEAAEMEVVPTREWDTTP